MSDIFLPYLSPPPPSFTNCPYACCNNPQAVRQKFPSSFAYYQKPRYSMPGLSTHPVNYQLVPIRHSMGFNRATPARSIQSLNTFAAANRANADENARFGTGRNLEERRSPYYYNELTRMHAGNSNSTQFIPISNGNNLNDENFIDFINTIHPE